MSPQYTSRPSCLPARFPNRIRHYRLLAGLTQAQLGQLVGVGKNTISSWERGLSCPVAPCLMKLAKGLSTLSESLYPDFYLLRRPGSEVSEPSA